MDGGMARAGRVTGGGPRGSGVRVSGSPDQQMAGYAAGVCSPRETARIGVISEVAIVGGTGEVARVGGPGEAAIVRGPSEAARFGVIGGSVKFGSSGHVEVGDVSVVRA